MADAAVGHGEYKPGILGLLRHVALYGLPKIQNLPTAEGPDVVDALEQHRILQAFADGPGIVLDAQGQFLGCEVGISHV